MSQEIPPDPGAAVAPAPPPVPPPEPPVPPSVPPPVPPPDQLDRLPDQLEKLPQTLPEETSFRDADPVTVLATLVAGVVGLALRGIDAAARPAGPGIAGQDTPLTGTKLLLLAGLTVPVAAVQGLAAVAARLGGALRPAVRFAAQRTPLGRPIEAGRRSLLELGERERAAQQQRERFSAAVTSRLIEIVAAGVIDRLDVDAIIARVDIAALVERIDVDAVIAKADLDAVIDRLDLDAVIARVDVGRVLDRIDVDAVARRIDLEALLARVDVDALAARVDIQAIIDRVDIAALTREVMDQVDIGQIVRESTGSMTSETVDAVRYQGMNADRLVSKIVDRILRRDGRDLTLVARRGLDGGPVAHAAPSDEP